MKKRTIILICIFSIAILGGGGFGVYTLVKNSGEPVSVTSVSSLNQSYWGSTMSSYGTITSKATQEVHLDTNELIDQVYVQEGDKVKVGDKLLAYDTTLLELNLESYELEAQAIDLEITGAEKDLKKLKSTTPIKDSEGSSSSLEQWMDGEARVVQNTMNLTAVSDETAVEEGQAETLAEAAGIAEASVTEAPATETTAAEAPATEAPVTEAPATEAPATEAPVTEPQTTEAPATETPATETPATEPQTKAALTEPSVSEPATTPDSGSVWDDSGDTIVLDPSQDNSAVTSPTESEEDRTPVTEEKEAYKVLNERSKPYAGEGTLENPYVFFCADGVVIQSSFMNKILGFDGEGTSKENGGFSGDGKESYAILEIRKEDDISGEVIRSVKLKENSSSEKAFSTNSGWKFSVEGLEEELPPILVDVPGDWLNTEDMYGFWEDDVVTDPSLDETETGSTGDIVDIETPEGPDESESESESETESGIDGTESESETESGIDGTESESETESGIDGTESESETESGTDGTESESESESNIDGTESESESESETGMTPAETETESETESETETETSPLGRIKANKILTYNTKPYKGDGTKENPYVFFCTDGAIIRASFMNKILGFNESGTSRKNGGMKGDGEGCYAILEIREGDEISGGFIKSIQIRGTTPTDQAFDPDLSWEFTTAGLQKIDPELPDETEEETFDDSWLDGGEEFWDDGDVYTESELKQAIEDKEKEISDLKLNRRTAELKVTQAQRQMEESTVVSSIHGVVKKVGDPAVGEIDGEAFILVTSDSGLYVQGTLSELELQKVSVGSTVTGYSYESYTNFSAEITEISKYPGTSNYWSSDSNPSVSYYPFLAYIEDAEGLSDYEFVELTIQEDLSENDSLYIPQMYVRKENGQSYVYIKGSDGLLKKQYVRTGQTLYGEVVEIKEGLTINDSIAFPYGKNVKEGAKTKNASAFADEDELDDSMDYEEYEDIPDDSVEDMGEEVIGEVEY